MRRLRLHRRDIIRRLPPVAIRLLLREATRHHLRATVLRPHPANLRVLLTQHTVLTFPPCGGRCPPKPQARRRRAEGGYARARTNEETARYNILPRVSGPAATATATITQHAAI